MSFPCQVKNVSFVRRGTRAVWFPWFPTHRHKPLHICSLYLYVKVLNRHNRNSFNYGIFTFIAPLAIARSLHEHIEEGVCHLIFFFYILRLVCPLLGFGRVRFSLPYLGVVHTRECVLCTAFLIGSVEARQHWSGRAQRAVVGRFLFFIQWIPVAPVGNFFRERGNTFAIITDTKYKKDKKQSRTRQIVWRKMTISWWK